MQIYFSSSFLKNFRKLNPKIKDKFQERKDLFLKNSTDRILNIHKLQGKFREKWSMNITGDYRAVFEKEEKYITFIAIGTHKELYG